MQQTWHTWIYYSKSSRICKNGLTLNWLNIVYVKIIFFIWMKYLQFTQRYCHITYFLVLVLNFYLTISYWEESYSAMEASDGSQQLLLFLTVIPDGWLWLQWQLKGNKGGCQRCLWWGDNFLTQATVTKSGAIFGLIQCDNF